MWEGASFTVRRGEFVAVIGPNGAGKTTLFRLLLGLQRPTRGTITVFGDRPRRGDARIGYVPQRHSVDQETHVTCETLVRLGVAGTRWGPGTWPVRERGAALDALQAVGARELAEQRIGSLSGGELQRIFLAEALVGEPEMLLLDEPLSNLDVRRTRDLVDLIAQVTRSRRVTTLFVAHDINPLIRYLDQVVYIANGRVATGPPDEVLTSGALTTLYGSPVEVLHDSRGNVVVVGGESDRGGESG